MTYVLSIETVPGVAQQYGFHLGTDARLARQIVAEKFAARVAYGLPVVTMALKRLGKLEAVYYGGGQWSDDDHDEGNG